MYPEYLAQLGGYTLIWNEAHPDDQIAEAHLVRFAKDSDTCTHHRWGAEVLARACEAFRLQRAMYEIDGDLRKATR